MYQCNALYRKQGFWSKTDSELEPFDWRHGQGQVFNPPRSNIQMNKCFTPSKPRKREDGIFRHRPAASSYHPQKRETYRGARTHGVYSAWLRTVVCCVYFRHENLLIPGQDHPKWAQTQMWMQLDVAWVSCSSAPKERTSCLMVLHPFSNCGYRQLLEVKINRKMQRL